MKEIQLTRGQVALVDDDDYHYLSQFSWYVVDGKTTYYAVRAAWDKVKKRCYHVLMHREIMKTPKHLDVDHIDHNGLNNQKFNLRNCTKAENNMNGLPRNNSTSKYLGVSLRKIRSKYKTKNGDVIYYEYPSLFVAVIQYNKKYIHLGYFNIEEDAARAYDRKAIELFGEFAHTNFLRSEYNSEIRNNFPSPI